MNNINAFLKLKANEKHISVNELAKLTNKSQSYISRILNNQIVYSNENRTIKQICYFLNIKKTSFNYKSNEFINMFYQFIDHTCFCNKEERDSLYKKILNYRIQFSNSPLIVYIYLSILIYKSLNIHFVNDNEFKPIEKKLLYIYKSLDSIEKQVFCIIYAHYLIKLNQSDLSLFYINQIDVNDINNDSLKTLFYSTNLSIQTHINKINMSCTNYYLQCRNICKKNKNIKRLINISIIYSNYLMKINCLDEAIEMNINIIDKVLKNTPHNLCIIYNNIAWGYMLKHDYKEALKYYNLVDKNKIDDDILFNMAWCKYQLKDYKHTRIFLEEAKEIEVSNPIYPILNDWLIAMMNKKYSLKTYQLLCEIEDEHSEYLSMDMQHFIEIEKLNYYTHNHKEKEALKLTKKIIDSSFIYSSVIKL